MSLPVFSTLKVEKEGSLLIITLNRPEKFNAFNKDMYEQLIEAFAWMDREETVSAGLLTGAGSHYSSGNDLTGFMSGGDPEEMAKGAVDLLTRFLNGFIDLKKPLMVGVNGVCIGVAVTTLALCDIVYCSSKATFQTPFTDLGQSPEGASSYLFSRMMGRAKANEMLLMGKKLTAQEAVERNLCAAVIPDEKFKESVRQLALELAAKPPQSLRISKALVTAEKEKLRAVCAAEIKALHERWTSEECLTAVINFFEKQRQKSSKKSKL